ncbi:hypothetical protein AYL99_03873 [Fonsecaea erecta]|uniref:Uncharacterized protein n=1 Tax=Fonsecaea erecta TaxID=1367422 RepID=A0A178ZPD4_9EURO|nr:hypothetical protein AYL99_03873 [Fonsecaea erecta]OAP61670.1 hypothetical protein AYL99_03873 [Fonsecaea erecta]
MISQEDEVRWIVDRACGMMAKTLVGRLCRNYHGPGIEILRGASWLAMNMEENPQVEKETEDLEDPCRRYQKDPGCGHVFGFQSQFCRRRGVMGFEYASVWMMALGRSRVVCQVDLQIACEVADENAAWVVGNDGEAKQKTFYRAISWGFRLSKIAAANVVHEVGDQDVALGQKTSIFLLLDDPSVVNEVGRLVDLRLCPAVAGVDVSGADPLRLASDSSSMGSFETSPCNAERHLRRCRVGRFEGLGESNGRSDGGRETVDLDVG